MLDILHAPDVQAHRIARAGEVIIDKIRRCDGMPVADAEQVIAVATFIVSHADTLCNALDPCAPGKPNPFARTVELLQPSRPTSTVPPGGDGSNVFPFRPR